MELRKFGLIIFFGLNTNFYAKITRCNDGFSNLFDNYFCCADPYLNTDAGTMSPFEHGEVYVLDDGGEVILEEFSYSVRNGVRKSTS